MAPGSGSDNEERARDQSRGQNGTDNSDGLRRDNPFVRFRNNVDDLAASVFTDIAEAFPSLQKYVPPPNKSFLDEWAREAFRRFNDSYERSTNPERKGIERMSCYEDKTKGQEGNHLINAGRRWEDRRKDLSSTQNPRAAAESSASTTQDPIRPNMGDLLHLLGLPAPGNLTRWKPSGDYLRYSPYSPIQLENDSLTLDHGTMWREAFEDLLRTNQGLPMCSSDVEGRRNLAAPKEAWIESLLQRRLAAPSRQGSFLLDIIGFPHPSEDAGESNDASNMSNDEFLERGYLPNAAIQGIAKGVKDFDTILRLMNEEDREAEQSEDEKPSWTRCPGLLEMAADEQGEDGFEAQDEFEIQDADEEEIYPNFMRFVDTSSEANLEHGPETHSDGSGLGHEPIAFVDRQSRGVSNAGSTERSFTTRELKDGSIVEYESKVKHLSDGSMIHHNTKQTNLPDGDSIRYSTTNTLCPDGTEKSEEVSFYFEPDGRVRDYSIASFESRNTIQTPPKNLPHSGSVADVPTRAVHMGEKDRQSILEAAKEHQKETEKKTGGWFWSN